ncbi:hypothetical protein MAR_028144 [Mya arenaria]|uniref:Uncharacterized protein n=1 Tax=Mya arenaria TaxID=6604 RepID=A0ABY7DDT9_MYAAR|nr:hypothetical protein MAR_028144 [Mya arenaria]
MGKQKSQNVTLVDKPKVISVDYQLLVAERDDLLESEQGYKRRLEQLEKEAGDTLKSFDVLYNENKILRSKLETPDGAQVDSIESYNTVHKDREHLREANRAFKRRIRQLENDIGEEQAKYNDLYSKNQLVTQKAQLETEFATRARDEKIDDLERDHDEMSEKLKMFLKEREQYEYRIAEMEKERNELQNKYDFLAEEKHEFQLRCDILQADREKLKEKVADIEDKIPDPEIKAKEEQQFLALQAQVAALQVANTDGSKEIHKLHEEIRVLNKLKKDRVEMIDRASSVIVDKEVAERQKIEQEEKDTVTHELEEQKKRAIFVLKENDELKSKNATLEVRLETLEKDNGELRKELNIKQAEIEDLRVHVRGGDSLNEEYLALEERFKDLRAEKNALENELVQEKKMAKLTNMEQKNEIENLKNKLNETEKNNMKNDSDIQRLQIDNSSLNKVTEAQALELRNMKKQLEQIQRLLDDRTEKYEEMKKVEKESQQELRESRITLHVTRHELDNLKLEKAGHFETLRGEMETAKTQRQEETEQMRKETIRLREEVKLLKDYEYKITTMDSEIRRLMNRLRMSDQFIKLPKKVPKKDGEVDEVTDLKRKQRILEREKIQLLQEKKQWEILKERFAELQNKNKRITEENKRSSVATKPKLQAIFENERPKLNQGTVGLSAKRGLKPLASKIHKTYDRKTTKTSLNINEDMRSKKPSLPGLESNELKFGKGYADLHKNKYKTNATLGLLPISFSTGGYSQSSSPNCLAICRNFFILFSWASLFFCIVFNFQPNIECCSVPMEVRFFGAGGMKASKPKPGLLKQVKMYGADLVVVSFGGKDITTTSVPKDIVAAVLDIAQDFLDSGVSTILVLEIGERGAFRDGLGYRSFASQRARINQLLRKRELVEHNKHCRMKFVFIYCTFATDYSQSSCACVRACVHACVRACVRANPICRTESEIPQLDMALGKTRTFVMYRNI